MTDGSSPEEALGQLGDARTRYVATEAAHEEARTALIEAVLVALRAGAAPSVVARTSDFTDAYVRKIARENGIAPAKPGIKPGTRASKKAGPPTPKPPAMRQK